jgi:hypothetical protein
VFQKPFTTGEPDLAGFEDQSTPDRKLTAAAMSSQLGGGGSQSLGRRTYPNGLETLVWKADDENDDELVYDILYRREGETAWKPLRRNVTDAILVWDTTTVPNGTYFIKVVASDAASNPTSAGAHGRAGQLGVRVDNTAPQSQSAFAWTAADHPI